jgi:Glycosyltransferase
MKINMYGGALTISYSLAKLLRRKGLDVTLFIDKKLFDKSYAPDWEDEELKAGYPEWIKIIDAKFSRAICGDGKSIAFARQLADCDILHLHAEAYLWSNLIDKSFLYQSHGFDLDQIPFNRKNAKQLILSIFARRAIRRASRAITIPHQRVFLERLGIAEKEVYLPFPMDLDKYTRVNSKEFRAQILSSHNADLIFFHPSRHEWVDNPTTNNKGNDKVLRAFALYAKMARRSTVLILTEKGRNVSESKKLIDDLGIREKVVWLEPMPKLQLISYYSASDIVLDQFNLGNFGQIFLEAMACGTPTFAFLKGYDAVYPEPPPAINVFTTEDIAKNLSELSEDRARLEDLGLRSRAWVQKYHGWQQACDKFIELYKVFMEEQSRC